MNENLITKHIELIKRQMSLIDKIGANHQINSEFDFGLNAWKSSTIILLERIFGKDNRKIAQIEKIKLNRHDVRNTGVEAYNISSIKNEGTEILTAAIIELETLGLPPESDEKNDNKINLTIIQNQEQEQNQRIKLNIIIDAFQEELTGKQLKELQEIIDSESDNKTKKLNIIEKLKTFGSDILTNIVASILTNPNIYG
jgi:Fe2+ transport system protein B